MLLGLMGNAGVGKDTIARILVEEHGFTQLAFADPLRELALELAPLLSFDSTSLADMISDSGSLEVAKREWSGVRRILQALGGDEAGTTGLRKVFGTDFWIQRLEERIQQEYFGGIRYPARDCVAMKNYVITDVSFQNEVNWIAGFTAPQNVYKRLGLLVTVTRPACDQKRVDSEPAIPAYARHIRLSNDGTERVLRAKVSTLVHYARA